MIQVMDLPPAYKNMGVALAIVRDKWKRVFMS